MEYGILSADRQALHQVPPEYLLVQSYDMTNTNPQ